MDPIGIIHHGETFNPAGSAVIRRLLYHVEKDLCLPADGKIFEEPADVQPYLDMVCIEAVIALHGQGVALEAEAGKINDAVRNGRIRRRGNSCPEAQAASMIIPDPCLDGQQRLVGLFRLDDDHCIIPDPTVQGVLCQQAIHHPCLAIVTPTGTPRVDHPHGAYFPIPHIHNTISGYILIVGIPPVTVPVIFNLVIPAGERHGMTDHTMIFDDNRFSLPLLSIRDCFNDHRFGTGSRSDLKIGQSAGLFVLQVVIDPMF